jgi:hypothetical protein
MVFEKYVVQCQAEGEDITLNTPLFREMLEALEAIDMDALNDTIPDRDDEEMMSYEDSIANCLLSDYGELLSVYTYEDYSSPLVLPIKDGEAIHIPVNVSCMFNTFGQCLKTCTPCSTL